MMYFRTRISEALPDDPWYMPVVLTGTDQFAAPNLLVRALKCCYHFKKGTNSSDGGCILLFISVKDQVHSLSLDGSVT